MINTQELRLGNWVYLFGDAVALTKGHLVYLLTENRQPDAITLSEEWLVKFGFDRFKNDGMHGSGLIKDGPNDLLVVKLYGDEAPWGWRFYGGDGVKDKVYLEYVHQLQNLYFALTGTELTIKE